VTVIVEDEQNRKSSQHDAAVVVVDKGRKDLADPNLTMMTAVADHID
jgi:hypothetical protein